MRSTWSGLVLIGAAFAASNALGAAWARSQAPPMSVAPGSAIIIDKSQAAGNEIECLVVRGGSVWCSLSKLGQATPLPHTCGVRLGDDFAAIFCRRASGEPFPVAQRAEPALNARFWKQPSNPQLLNLLSAGDTVAIAGSHIACYSPAAATGGVVCAPGGAGQKKVSIVEMTRKTVAIGSMQGGKVSSQGLVRSTRFP